MADIIAWSILGLGLGWLFWRQLRISNSAAKPAVSADAKITKIMSKIGPIKLGRSSGFKTMPGSYVTFLLTSGNNAGKKRTVFIDSEMIVAWSVGDGGVLTMQGVRFVDFVMS